MPAPAGRRRTADVVGPGIAGGPAKLGDQLWQARARAGLGDRTHRRGRSVGAAEAGALPDAPQHPHPYPGPFDHSMRYRIAATQGRTAGSALVPE